MWECCKTGLAVFYYFIEGTSASLAQDVSPLPKAPSARFGAEILASIGLPNPSLTPIQPTSKPNNLPVKILYDGPKLKGDYVLDVVLSKPDRKKETRAIRPLSRSILYLDGFDAETDLALNLTAGTDDLQLEATLRDTNGNLILQTSHPIPVVSEEPRLLRLSNPNIPLVAETGIPDFTNLETIIGKVTLPRKTVLPLGAKLHVQLLENALAGGLSMALVAEDTRDARLNNGELAFVLHRGLWDGQNPEDLSIKAWITDTVGRQIYVMNVPVGYNGPDIEYDIRLVGLKQGKNTKRGRTLPHELMAQTLIQGEAAFDLNAARNAARSIAIHSAETVDLFADNEDDPKSEAKASIWENYGDFTAKADELENVAAGLASSIQSAADLGPAMAALGAACKSCHAVYRE